MLNLSIKNKGKNEEKKKLPTEREPIAFSLTTRGAAYVIAIEKGLCPKVKGGYDTTKFDKFWKEFEAYLRKEKEGNEKRNTDRTEDLDDYGYVIKKLQDLGAYASALRSLIDYHKQMTVSNAPRYYFKNKDTYLGALEESLRLIEKEIDAWEKKEKSFH